jgi:hypothetical protein
VLAAAVDRRACRMEFACPRTRLAWRYTREAVVQTRAGVLRVVLISVLPVRDFTLGSSQVITLTQLQWIPLGERSCTPATQHPSRTSVAIAVMSGTDAARTRAII